MPPPHQRACRFCSAVLWEDKPYCWLCHQALDGSGVVPDGATFPPLMPPPLPPEPSQHFTFSLSTLMLAMTLCAVLSGLCATAPGLGIPLAILAVPAWIRAARVIRLDPWSRPNASLGKKVEAFMASLGFALLVCLAAGAAGFAACTGIVLVGAGAGSNNGNDALAILPIGLIIGGIIALYIFVILSMKFWPGRKK